MISRRPFDRHNRGRVPSGVPEVNPLTIFGASLLQWVRADLGITVATGVSQWSDQSGNGLHYTQGTGANQPAFLASGGPNGGPAVQVVDTTDTLTSTLSLPAPGTTPTTILAVCRQDANTAARRVITNGLSSITVALEQNGGAAVRQNSGTAANAVNYTIGTWGRSVAHFSNNTSAGGGAIPAGDWHRFIATQASGASAGNNSSTNRSIAAGGGVAALFTWAELLYISRAITETELASYDSYVTAFFGAGLV